MAGAESEGELSTPALFSGWELFSFSLGAILFSLGEKKKYENGKQAEHKEYIRPCSTGCVQCLKMMAVVQFSLHL